MRKKAPAKQQHLTGEAAMAAELVNKLGAWGWEVFQEVMVGGRVADIVARRGKILWAIECKMTFSLAVIEQAFRNKGYCHLSSVAIPKITSGFSKLICQNYGIGVITTAGKYHRPNQVVRAKLNRRIHPPKLYEEQKTWLAAGSNGGGHFTPFKQTCKKLVEVVEGDQGILFNDAIKRVDHHYSSFSSARSCLLNFIGTVIPELRLETIDKKLCLFLSNKYQKRES